ncbi:glycosyltransferase family 32 protein [Xylariaceae sp. FL0016]|nr:glycosyltransferase family 32 protein [Xylariaceae sp. FL0016]
MALNQATSSRPFFCVFLLLALAFAIWRLSPPPALHLESPTQLQQPPSSNMQFADLFRGTSLIPRKIWQICYFVTPEILVDTASWLALNQDYQYTLVGLSGGDAFVHHHFSNEPAVISAYHELGNTGLKSDLLRYFMLSVEGGVYTDIDTYAHKPIDLWVPSELRSDVRLIVGIEFDRHGGGAWAEIPHYVQFCQWTVAAAPAHPVFSRMVDRALSSLEALRLAYGTTLAELHPTSFEVMNSTGPAAWTDVVFEFLQEANPDLKSLEDLSGLTEPTLIGDVLVYPIDGFGMNQPHSQSTNDGTIPEMALLEHHFRGHWRPSGR